MKNLLLAKPGELHAAQPDEAAGSTGSVVSSAENPQPPGTSSNPFQERDLRLRGWHTAALVVLLLSAGFQLQISAGMTSSGRLAVFGSDILGFAALVFLAYDYFFLRKYRTRYTTIQLLAILVFYSYSFLVTIIRLLTGFKDFQSLAIPRANIMTVWLLILATTTLFSIRELHSAGLIFGGILGVISIPLVLAPENITMLFFELPVIRDHIQLIITPVLLLGFIYAKRLKIPNWIKFIFPIHFASTFYCTICSGARFNAVLLLALIVSCCIAIWTLSVGEKKWKLLVLGVVAPIIVTLVAVTSLYRVDYQLQYGAIRSASFIGVKLNPVAIDSNHKKIDSRKEAAESTKESTNTRTKLWTMSVNDLKGKWVFGCGLRLYKITYNTVGNGGSVIIHPHNFILEYTMGFGIVGLLLWLTQLLIFVASIFIRSLHTNMHIKKTWLLIPGLVIFSGLFVSLVQPLMLYPNILFALYFSLGTTARSMWLPATAQKMVRRHKKLTTLRKSNAETSPASS